MKFNQFLIKYRPFLVYFFLPALLISIFIILGNYITIENSLKLGDFLTLMAPILLFVHISFFLYLNIYLYMYLDIYFSSFFSFLFNLFIFALYIFGFYNLIMGLPNPIYLQDLSSFSFYRYVTLLLFTIFAIILYYISEYLYPPLTIYFKIINYPYLKQEIYRIIDSSLLDSICSYLIGYIDIKNNRYYLLFLDIFFSYCINFLQIALFLNFVINHGDLRYNIYFLPLSFIAFLYSYFKHAFNMFFQGHCNYIRSLLHVTVKKDKDLTKEEKDLYILNRPLSDLNFNISQYGYIKGYDVIDLPSLTNSWCEAARIYCFFSLINSKLYYLNLVLTHLRVSSWFLVVVFTLKQLPYISAGLSDIFKTSFRSFHSSSTLHSPTKIYRVPLPYQKRLEETSKGSYKSGHYVTTDTDLHDGKGNVPFINQPTHGKGPINNPSREMHPSKDALGKNIPQNAVYPPEPLTFPQQWLGQEIPDSEAFCADPAVKENILKHSKYQPKDLSHEESKSSSSKDPSSSE